jgi:hypothetical protein
MNYIEFKFWWHSKEEPKGSDSGISSIINNNSFLIHLVLRDDYVLLYPKYPWGKKLISQIIPY